MSEDLKQEPKLEGEAEYQPPVEYTPQVTQVQAHQAPETVKEQPSPVVPDEIAKRAGRRKITIDFIEDKSRRHITFSKRKAGIMKKAYELSTLTGTQVLLLVASETGHVYTFATPKLQPLITKPDGKNLIQACLNAPDTLQVAPNSHSAQMSPGTPGYPQHPDHSIGMTQAEYTNQSSPAQPSYDHGPGQNHHGPEDDKSSMGYGMQRFADVKSYRAASPSQDINEGNDGMRGGMAYPYPSGSHMMNSGMRGMPYPHSGGPGPSLPNLTDRGSFSNLPNPSYQFTPGAGGNSYPNNFPSHNFASNGPSQLFSKASNLPTLPPRNENM